METSDMAHIDQNLLQELPVGLLIVAADGRIEFANAHISELLGMREEQLLCNTLTDLPTQAQRLLASEPLLYHDIGNQRWIKRETHRAADGERLHMLMDVSEQERLAEENARLRQQVEDLRLTDELTGLPNRRAISQALDLQVSRSRRYQNPLSVVLAVVDLQHLASVRPLSTDPVVLAVSRFLRDRLRWVDQIGRWDEDEFVLVLPETSHDDAEALLDKIRAEQETMRLPEPYDDIRPQLAFGLACWSKGDDMRTLLRRAHDNLRGDA